MSNIIDHPDHYCSGGIETIDYMRAKCSTEEFTGYLKCNVFKYLSRAGKKDDIIQDLKKAQWYLNTLILEMELNKADVEVTNYTKVLVGAT